MIEDIKIVDVSGFGHSGKTAIVDYLKQFDTVFSFSNQVEFELYRVPGGLLDLYFSLYEGWNQIRSTARLKEFYSLIKRIGQEQSSLNPISYFTASGHSYDKLFNNRFIGISKQFINDIILFENKMFWPYENLKISPIEVFYNKFKNKYFNSLTKTNVYFSDRNTFMDNVHNYIQSLFREVVSSKHTHVMLCNAFEPYNPKPCLDMSGDAYSIIVDRDPRDIYASLINDSEVFVPKFEKYKSASKIKKEITNFENIHAFIDRIKINKGNVINCEDKRILRIRYESFVLNHTEESNKLINFLGLKNESMSESKIFNPVDSSRNIGIWKKYKNLPEIKLIEKELGQYCYQE